MMTDDVNVRKDTNHIVILLKDNNKKFKTIKTFFLKLHNHSEGTVHICGQLK